MILFPGWSASRIELCFRGWIWDTILLGQSFGESWSRQAVLVDAGVDVSAMTAKRKTRRHKTEWHAFFKIRTLWRKIKQLEAASKRGDLVTLGCYRLFFLMAPILMQRGCLSIAASNYNLIGLDWNRPDKHLDPTIIRAFSNFAKVYLLFHCCGQLSHLFW